VSLVEAELAAQQNEAELSAALVAAVAILVRLYAESDEWEGTVRLLEPRLTAAEGDPERVAILTETAGLLEKRRGDVDGAFEAIWRAFLILPGADLAASAIRLARASLSAAVAESRAADRFGVIAAALDEGLAERALVTPEVARDLFWNV